MPNRESVPHQSLVPTSGAANDELRWLFDLTAIPTASGREQGVIRWIELWVEARPDLRLVRDGAGNLVIERADAKAPESVAPLFITAHLDHPAFVVERTIGPGAVGASFRGGVMDPYFRNAPVVVFPSGDGAAGPIRGTVVHKEKREPFHQCVIELEGEGEASGPVRPGDIARWDLPEPAIEGDVFHTHACDDLAAAAAALAALDRIRSRPETGHTRLLFTRAEEVGFIGAIAACKQRTMPANSRVIALETSRSYPHDSPIGGGPIVRVGDRISTFSPSLTAAVARVAEKLAERRAATNGAARPPTGTGSIAGRAATGSTEGFKWQRKLMPGGACEASAFQAYGYEATCVCLPLGNYHNMADLEGVQRGDVTAVSAARAGREFISVSDYRGMIDLLEFCASGLAQAEPLAERMEKLFADKAFVLDG